MNEFLSETWRQAATASMNRLLEECADEVVGVDFSICEVFVNVPTALEPARQVVWHFRMVDGVAEYRWDTTVTPDDLFADVRLVMDAQSAAPLATLVVGGDADAAADLARLAADAGATGRFRSSGSVPTPSFYDRFHDMSAAATVSYL